MDQPPPRPLEPGRRRLAIWELCVLVAGLAVGIWLFTNPGEINPFALWIGALGGAAVVGPPLLLRQRRRRKSKYGPGEILWFSSGTSGWLLWPPIVYGRLTGPAERPMGGSTAANCFAYGTPLMAIYVGAALLFGGHVRRRNRRRRRQLPLYERFGLALGALWAATGFYVLYLVYGEGLNK